MNELTFISEIKNHIRLTTLFISLISKVFFVKYANFADQVMKTDTYERETSGTHQ